jgi:predicted RNA-binding Zn ribbon-like protein
MHEDLPAPGSLALVQELINTLDVETGVDSLSADWLRSAGLVGDEALSLDAVRELREALRGVLVGHHDGTVDADAVAALDALARSAPVLVGFAPDGAVGLQGSGVIARVLAIVAAASGDGTWERLKVCGADDCRWAFYDASRNHSRTWCSMSVCGNRAKARAYRQRASAS